MRNSGKDSRSPSSVLKIGNDKLVLVLIDFSSYFENSLQDIWTRGVRTSIVT